jgi:tetratricopeptide (TPR) repeat protein
MVAVVTDSLRLLAERERACLAGSSVFDGGFTLEAASNVLCEGESALASIETLVAHSLLRVTPGPAPRFAPYEVIREVMTSELEARPDLRDAVRARHRAHFVRWARSAERDELDAELQNLLRAHAYALEDDVPDAIALALTLAPVLAARSLPARAKALFDATVDRARAEGQTDRGTFRALLAERARSALHLGALEAASRDLKEALSGAEDPLERARIHVLLGTIVETRGDTEGAREELRAALVAPLPEIEAEARAAVAHTYRREGRLDEAEREIAASIALYRAVDDVAGLSRTVFEAGVIALFR